MSWRDSLRSLDPRHKRLLALGVSLVAIWVVFDLVTGGLFFSPRNFYNLAVQSSTVALLTVGMVLVIITRNIDLSVGSVLGLTGMVIAILQIEVFPAAAGWNWPLTLAIGLLAGILIGLWQGFLVAYVGIPSFVVTLAGLLIFRGLTFEISQGQTFSPFQPGYRIFGGGQQGSLGEAASWIVGVVALVVLLGTLARRVRSGEASLPFSLVGGLFASALTLFMIYQFNAYDRPRTEIGYGIPSPLLLLVLAATTIGLFVNRAPVGRHVYAVGQNLEAARLVGVPVRRVVLKVFALMGALCAVGAVITTSRLNAGTTNLGTLLELNVIAAAVIGGASLDGGRGSILGGILGAFVIQSLDTGMVLVGVSSSLRQILIGFVLIGAVWVDRIAVRKT